MSELPHAQTYRHSVYSSVHLHGTDAPPPPSFRAAMASPNDSCPRPPTPFLLINCHACRLICKYSAHKTLEDYTSNAFLDTALVDISAIPLECPNCNHEWNTSLTPYQRSEDVCQLCHLKVHTPALICWACKDSGFTRFGDGFRELCDGRVCGRCKMVCDSSCTAVWVRRDVEYRGVEVLVDLTNGGKLEYLDKVEDIITARRREVEKRKRGVRSHLQV